MEQSNINEKKYSKKELEKYNGFLHIIAFISLATIGLEILISYCNIHSLNNARITLAVISALILLAIVFTGYAITSANTLYEPMDNLIKNFDRGRVVTVIFFAFLISMLAFIIQDGGAKESCITNIMLISSSFGYFFAQKHRIRVAVAIASWLSYVCCIIFYYDKNIGRFYFHPIKDMALFVCAVMVVWASNLFITRKISKAGE